MPAPNHGFTYDKVILCGSYGIILLSTASASAFFSALPETFSISSLVSTLTHLGQAQFKKYAQLSLMTHTSKQPNIFSYLRACWIFFRYSSSHACALIARIPETTWFIKEMRLSETAAVRSRSAAPV